MSCEKKNFTYGQGLEEHKHELLEFADIQIGRDNELCIDPARIHLLALSGDKWAIKADSMINSYFFALFDAAKAKDYLLVEGLVKNHCGEINYTQLGMSKYEPSGNGASYRLVYPAIYQMIERGLFEKDLIVSISDIPIWTKRIGGDRLSDWVTNIIWPVLEEFTLEQYEKYQIECKNLSFEAVQKWDGNRDWTVGKSLNIMCGNYKILLCPKRFLHKRLLFNTDDYLYKQVLVYRQKQLLNERSNLCKEKEDKYGNKVLIEPTKKDLMQYDVKGQDHIDYILLYTEQNPNMVKKYHDNFELRPANDSRFITDEELDAILYG